MFLSGELPLGDYLYLANMDQIDTATASGGVVTTTANAFTCGEEVLLMIGTFNADDDGTDPIKSLMYHAVVQGANDRSDQTVSLGLGTFYYWAFPDQTDLSMTLLAGDSYATYANGTNLDWSEDPTVDYHLRITFADEDYGLFSYYQPNQNRWWNWYVTIDVNERACSTTSAMRITVEDYGVTGIDVQSDGLTVAIQLTSGRIFDSNEKPTGVISYDLDAEGPALTGAGPNHWVHILMDCTSMTPGGSQDNDSEFDLIFDLGTDYDLVNMLSDGQIRTDATDQNYHINGAATYTVVT
jgi:hypothetical protein